MMNGDKKWAVNSTVANYTSSALVSVSSEEFSFNDRLLMDNACVSYYYLSL